MIKNRTRFLLFLVLSVLWMIVIYSKSAQPYQQQDIKPFLSEQISMNTLQALLPHIEFYYDGEYVTYTKPYSMLEFFIRKGGHLTEYFILAALFWGTLTATHLRARSAFWLAFTLAVLYASTDEYHQTFVTNRTGHPIDVAMDSCGAMLALLLLLILKIRRDKKASPRI
ncbi:MAG: VanZ family protein [Tumebacillaceae bacterium]